MRSARESRNTVSILRMRWKVSSRSVDPSTVAAVIVEPVAGAGGVLPPPKGYLKRLREITSKHGILLIFDEVVTGFGRLGAPFAAQALGVTPDLITCAKGMSNGAVPMGGVLVHHHVHEAMSQGPEATVELAHGYTYSGHPLACAAALATLDVYQEEGIFEKVARIAGNGKPPSTTSGAPAAWSAIFATSACLGP